MSGRCESWRWLNRKSAIASGYPLRGERWIACRGDCRIASEEDTGKIQVHHQCLGSINSGASSHQFLAIDAPSLCVTLGNKDVLEILAPVTVQCQLLEFQCDRLVVKVGKQADLNRAVVLGTRSYNGKSAPHHWLVQVLSCSFHGR